MLHFITSSKKVSKNNKHITKYLCPPTYKIYYKNWTYSLFAYLEPKNYNYFQLPTK